jgi:hypothetical protein
MEPTLSSDAPPVAAAKTLKRTLLQMQITDCHNLDVTDPNQERELRTLLT